jgi:hypothetical protein
MHVADAIGFDDDSIKEFPLSPLRESRTKRKWHKATRVIKKKKIQSPDVHNLSEYKMPNGRQMSPNAEKWLKIGITCSDGFEGAERHSTGTTMSTRLPRRHQKITRQKFPRGIELSLTSSRDPYDIIENPYRVHEQLTQSKVGGILHNKNLHAMKDNFQPLTSRVSEILKDKNKMYKSCKKIQLKGLSKLVPPFRKDVIDDSQEVRRVTTLQNTRRLKRHATFNDDVEIKIIQALTMMSAPIAVASQYDPDEVEDGMANNEDDRNSSDSLDASRDDEETNTDSDENHDSNTSSNTENDAGDERDLSRSAISLKATLEAIEHKEGLEALEQIKTQDRQ